MIITEIKYGYTFNKGQYESERIDIVASPEDGDTAAKVLSTLKDIVHGRTTDVPVKVVETIEEAKKNLTSMTEPEKAPMTVAPKRARGKQSEEKIKAHEEATETAKRNRIVAEAAAAEVKVEEEAPKAEPVTKAEEVVAPAPAPVTKVRALGTPYNREVDLHKKLVGEILGKEFPNWRKDTAKAMAASVALNGKEFLTKEGTIVESFKEELRKLMK